MERTEILFPDCELAISPYSFCVHAPTKAFAFGLIKDLRTIAAMAKRLLKREALIYYPGCTQPIQIPARMAIEVEESEPVIQRDNESLLGADYMRLVERLHEWQQQGKIIAIVSNTTNICHVTNDLLLPSRGYLSGRQFKGYNYLKSWRLNFEDDGRLNPQYQQLRDLLDRDGYVKGFNYTLYRPYPDDSLCEYATDYYLCENYCNDVVRIGVSDPQDWRLVQNAPR